MRQLLYTVLELEEWCSSRMPCSFCVSLKEEDKIICQIVTRSKVTHKLVATDFACQKCKEKFENNQIPKCDRCNRLRIKSDTDFITGKYLCRCIERGENIEEKELPVLPNEERASTRYERQINDLREKLTTAEETIELEREIHEDSMKVMDNWYTKYQNADTELIKRVMELEEENKQLKAQQATQSTAQIEVKEVKKWPWSRIKK